MRGSRCCIPIRIENSQISLSGVSWKNSGLASISLGSAARHMRSALEHPDVIDDYLAEECKRGHVLGPFKQLPAASLVVSRFGVIPKRGRENKWRLFVDLSLAGQSPPPVSNSAVSSRPTHRSQTQLLHWAIGYICPSPNVIGAQG